MWIPFDLEAQRELELAVFDPGSFCQPRNKTPKGSHVQFKLLLDLGIGSKFTLWGGDIVDTVVEGAAHGGRLRGQRNIERLDAHDLDEQLPVGFTGPFLGPELLDLSRILILSSASASAIAKWHGH